MTNPQHGVSFSGGKDSTAMLLMMLERGMQIDKILHVDMGYEFPAMYEHIKQINEYIKPLEIETINVNFDYWFAHREKKRGPRIGEIGYGWPNVFNRWCTALKRDALKKHQNRGDFAYIGIAADEKKRIKNNFDKTVKTYPLVQWGVTENEALEYCYKKGFTFGGLYELFDRASCWLCPLQSIRALNTLHDNFPELWQVLEQMDEDKGHHRLFKDPYSVADLALRFRSQRKLKMEDK